MILALHFVEEYELVTLGVAPDDIGQLKDVGWLRLRRRVASKLLWHNSAQVSVRD